MVVIGQVGRRRGAGGSRIGWVIRARAPNGLLASVPAAPYSRVTRLVRRVRYLLAIPFLFRTVIPSVGRLVVMEPQGTLPGVVA